MSHPRGSVRHPADCEVATWGWVWGLLWDSGKDHPGIVQDIIRCLGEEQRWGEERHWDGISGWVFLQVFPSCQSIVLWFTKALFLQHGNEGTFHSLIHGRHICGWENKYLNVQILLRQCWRTASDEGEQNLTWFTSITIWSQLSGVRSILPTASGCFPEGNLTGSFRQWSQEPVCGVDEPVTQTHKEARQKKSVNRST